jgi:hypothetical protein
VNCYYEIEVVLSPQSDLAVALPVAESFGFKCLWTVQTFRKQVGWHREAKDLLKAFVHALQPLGIQVESYSLSDVLIDSGMKDMFCLLGGPVVPRVEATLQERIHAAVSYVESLTDAQAIEAANAGFLDRRFLVERGIQ